MRYVLLLDLKEDSELIREYKYWHRQENICKEVPEGIRSVGIEEMEIYRWNNRPVMCIEAPEGFNYDRAMDELKQLPRQNAWERFMSKFQLSIIKAAPEEKWQQMNIVFSLSNCN